MTHAEWFFSFISARCFPFIRGGGKAKCANCVTGFSVTSGKLNRGNKC